VYLGKRISRGLFKSKEGIIINADINASFNILRKASTNCNINVTNVIEDLGFSPIRLNIRDNSNIPYKGKLKVNWVS
jgi:putative transposase